MNARRPAVAGMFYEGEREALIESIERCFLSRLGPGRIDLIGKRIIEDRTDEEKRRRVVGLVCPHAGYVYSGMAAAWAYDALALDGAPDVAVILGPNHHGIGENVAVSAASEWITPLGSVAVDREAADAIVSASHFARRDDAAHFREHSIEVQIPFLQYVAGERIAVVPVAIAHLSADDAITLASDLGPAIASALDGRNAVVIASTDFTHYESQSSAEVKDTAAIERILALDARGLIEVVEKRRITMCGAVGTAVMIEACKALGATFARQLAYYTSGEVSGDRAQVVGYAAISVER
jgi:AmmeMemoRadiSam system protein B